MSTQTWVEIKNILRKSKWWTRWTQQGGSMHWQARPMQDLRNEEDLRRWRELEVKRRHTKYGDAAVVNLAAWRMRRARRQAAG